MNDLDQRVAAFVGEAHAAARGVREQFERAGIAPEDVRTVDELARIPVMRKEELLERQRLDPPFAGYLGVDLTEVERIFVSPGPIFEPETKDRRGKGYGPAFRAAGIGPGDVALVTFSYHLSPAGLVLDEAFREVGATVVPGGIGNSELQAQLLLDLEVTGIAASTAFFQTLVDHLEEAGHDLPGAWSLRWALLAGELGDWTAKRRAIEERYQITTLSFYGVADIGVVGYEERGQEGYTVSNGLVVQICDPVSGQVLPEGAAGEVVVTPLSPSYPLIRFGTGDVSATLESVPGTSAARRLAPLSGRVGAGVKVRELFVYPRHLDDLAREVGAVRVVGEVTSENGRDQVRLRVATGSSYSELTSAIGSRFTALTRLRADGVEVVAADGVPDDEPTLVDRR